MRGTKLDETLIQKIKDHYKESKSSRKTALYFGVGKTTVLDYLKTPEEKRQIEKEKSKKNVERVKKRRRDLKKMAVDYKGGCCERCGYDKCIEALEFHHKDPNEKDFGIAHKGHTKSWEKIKKEVDKCILVCSNCHREIHAELRNKDR